MPRNLVPPFALAVALAAALPLGARAQDAQPAAPAAPATPATPAAADRPLAALPYTPSLDTAAMNRSADPCSDFFEYACGGWTRANPIPADQAAWSVYAKTALENQQYLWGVLEELGRRNKRTHEQQQLGDHFATCMDEQRANALGAAPLAPDLAAIAALSSPDELAPLLGRLDPTLGGILFDVSSAQDAKDTDKVIALVEAGGLGLPDRDYYVNNDARSVEIRERYLGHVARMLELAGDPPEEVATAAKHVLRLETELARASLTRVDKRDPHKVYHRMSAGELQALTPRFSWAAYARAGGATTLDPVNVTEPEFMRELDRLLQAEALTVWKAYLRFHLALARAPYLSAPFVDEQFAFHTAYLQGVKQMKPRWKRCVALVDRDLGEALGKEFVARNFPPALKGETTDLVRRVQAAMERRLQALPWMGDATKKEALAKLAGMRNKVGYPAKWRDYTRLLVKRGDLVGNVARAERFEHARMLAKIGRPVNRDEWDMTPPTVNAYYDPLMNDMNFPAGVLLPPLYDPRMDAAPNYGDTGGTVGHELVHGFDDEGRQYDAKGNLRDWWTAEDAKRFEERAQCVADQYAQYTVVDDVKINSKLSLGEDLADLAGVLLAWDAWRELTSSQVLAPRDDLTPEQRFFVGYAQWACGETRPEAARVRAVTDPHSPYRWRVNGVVVNVPEFREAFACKVGQPMAPKAEVCRVW